MEHNGDDGLIREPTVSLDDLLRGLIWPLLLRGPAMALRPERWLLGICSVVAIGLIGSISHLWRDGDDPSFTEGLGQRVFEPVGNLVESAFPWRWQPDAFVESARRVAYAPANLLDAFPLSVVVLGIPMLAVWCVFGLAISRSAACEVALARVVSGTDAFAFGLKRWLSGFASVFTPIAVIGAIHIIIATGGFLLLTWPGGNILGGLMHGFGMMLAAGAVLIGIAFLLGWIMLVPAVSCEGTDALDSVQRVYAYVVGRPARLLVYLVLVGLIGVVSFTVVSLVRELAILMADGAATQWAGNRALTIVSGAQTQGTGGLAASAMELWRTFFDVAVAGFIVSYVHTSGTLLYLLCRRVNDGQEIAELWTEDGR
ncbi:MAG: hypothetical protein RIB60_11675 [Phycisphaerales bacterium]